MTYTKPILTACAALDAIQSTQKTGMQLEFDQTSKTIPAYEADE